MPNTFPFYDAEPYWPKGGYGHHGGEEGSGSAATTDFYIFVDSQEQDAPSLSVLDEGYLERELMTIEELVDDETVTFYCYRYKNCPVGAQILGDKIPALFYGDLSRQGLEAIPMDSLPLYCPRPLDGSYIVGRVTNRK